MGMWHLQAEHHLCHLLAGESLLHGYGHALGKLLIAANFGVVHIKDVIYFAAGNHQCVTLHQRIDVQKSVELVVLGTLVAGNLASGNLTEYIHL